MNEQFDSAADQRTANNTLRHQYRALTDEEKAAMVRIKDAGLAFIVAVNETSIMTPREMALAKTKIEEAVMWAVKGITA